MNIEEINNELMEFQNRCRKLPKALKEWPAFHALKKTIDDFNDICPLLELMSNKAMKYRHWQKIQGITGIRILYPTRKEKIKYWRGIKEKSGSFLTIPVLHDINAHNMINYTCYVRSHNEQ